MISCGKEDQKNQHSESVVSSVPPYDTMAIDSFSAGATSVDVARKIRISSLQYQDSLKQVQKKLEEEKLLTKLKVEKEKAEKETRDKKIKDEENRKTATEIPGSQNTANP